MVLCEESTQENFKQIVCQPTKALQQTYNYLPFQGFLEKWGEAGIRLQAQ